MSMNVVRAGTLQVRQLTYLERTARRSSSYVCPLKISLHSKVKILENLDRGVDLTNKKSQIKIYFLEISENF